MSGRCTAAERDMRVAAVVEWVTEGQSRENIIALCRGKWGIKPRTVDAYLKRARELIGDEARAGVRAEIQGSRREARAEALEAAAPARLAEVPDRDVILLDVLNMLYAQYEAAKANGDPSTALKAAEKLAEVAGVRWSDRQKGMVDDDIKAAQEKAQRAFALLMMGARESRADRGLDPLPGVEA